jgi:hypothetical protein
VIRTCNTEHPSGKDNNGDNSYIHITSTRLFVVDLEEERRERCICVL